jgi:general secretion pathway protein D
MAKVMEGMFSDGSVQTVKPETIPGSAMTELGGAPSASPAVGVSRSSLGAPGGAASGTVLDSAAPGTTVTPRASGSGSPAASSVSTPSSSGLGSSGGNSSGGPGPRIVADEKNNALVIFAQPRQYRMIEAAIKKLDVVPVQVMIEATIAEVTLTDQLRYGLQFFFQKGNNAFSLSQLASGAVNSVFPGFNYVFASGNSRVVLDALSSVTNVHVLSAPQLMVLDHQTATLQVGDQVPIAVQQARSTIDPNAPIVNSIELRNTGVILRVTPRVNSTGMSTLVVDQEVSDVARTTTSNIDSPTIQQRRISSVVAVGDGDTIALGGLIRENRTIGKDGLPVLSDIPILGNLFSANSDTTNRTELLILLTPRVIKNRADAQAVTEELRSRLSDIRLVP